ncbi:hypothetical protein PF005_g2157 [Phytophthora fragariae]|uniref:RxLR effector protein n=1 Tax=Phytophthora fragariae TaxID=53985 RepID=A0A6A3MF77_9STRA|nr:hypothetical protein PF003_g27967 [Phytophthora fragariae]KAE8949321.1 hypothetical protein PF009_g1135 [Phytophthora fragariae]KAE9028608.1 hypothetical protein PF011_g1480 [Phytophthora fragariae]KAE9138471.1 hypothetical protein PF010_g954 [Phytophthora fragariae]KAE9139563.1 hypothetical protein PF007_g984 [Phytophthora fragariae]
MGLSNMASMSRAGRVIILLFYLTTAETVMATADAHVPTAASSAARSSASRPTRSLASFTK